MATSCHRANACDSASPIWLTSSGEAGGQAEAYLPKQPGLHHTSHRKNCHDSTTSRGENERVATGRERRENRGGRDTDGSGRRSGESSDPGSCEEVPFVEGSREIRAEDR